MKCVVSDFNDYMRKLNTETLIKIIFENVLPVGKEVKFINK